MKYQFHLAATAAGRFKGLIGRHHYRNFKPGSILVLAPCKSIHTFGMDVYIDVAFVSLSGEVLQTYESVPPRKVLCNRQATYVLERVATEDPWFEVGSTICLEAA
jgi:uncharacterized protein